MRRERHDHLARKRGVFIQTIPPDGLVFSPAKTSAPTVGLLILTGLAIGGAHVAANPIDLNLQMQELP